MKRVLVMVIIISASFGIKASYSQAAVSTTSINVQEQNNTQSLDGLKQELRRSIEIIDQRDPATKEAEGLSPVLGKAFISFAHQFNLPLLSIIVYDEQFKDVSSQDYIQAVSALSQQMSFPRMIWFFRSLKAIKTIRPIANRVFQELFKDERLNEMSDKDLKRLFHTAIQNGPRSRAFILKLLQSNRIGSLITPEDVDSAIQSKNLALVDPLRVYSALQQKENSKKLSPEDQEFYEAYKKFLKGDANHLKNLLFSNSGSDQKVVKPLTSLCYRETIKPLVLTLAQTKAQKRAAQSLLIKMNLYNDDAATKIQSTFKTYVVRKKYQARLLELQREADRRARRA